MPCSINYSSHAVHYIPRTYSIYKQSLYFLTPFFCFCQVHIISLLYVAHLCMKSSLGISNFLEEISSLSHSIVFLYFFALILSLLAVLWNSVFKWLYLSFSPLLFTSLLFTAICKASSDSHFAFLPFFFLGMVLITVQCHGLPSIILQALYQI